MYQSLENLYSYINTNFAAYLLEVNTAYGTTIPAPALITRSEHLNDQYPLVELEPFSGETFISDDDTPLNDGWELKTIRINLAHYEADIQTVQNTVLIYREVIKRMIKDDFTLGGLFNRVYLTEEEYSPLFQIEEQQTYMKAASQTVVCRKLY